MPLTVSRASRIALDLLFPSRCALCDRAGAPLCDSCAAALPPLEGARCPRCCSIERSGVVCAQCALDPPAFASLRSAFEMDAGARHLVHELKYAGLSSLAEPMARLLLGAAPPAAAPPSGAARPSRAALVVPVPLHPSRERARGYNQARLLADAYARLAGLSCLPRAARRIRATKPLAKTMRRDERLAIVAGAFAADKRLVEGRTILLVDDVATTGATLDACARALGAAGAASVHCITWARAS